MSRCRLLSGAVKTFVWVIRGTPLMLQIIVIDVYKRQLEKLIEEFGNFQGVGRKRATRMAYQVLRMSDKDAAALADAIRGAHTRLHRCRICQ